MIIAPKSSMKSQALSKATAPLARIQKQLATEDAARLKEWEKMAQEAELREEAWEKQCKALLSKAEKSKSVATQNGDSEVKE
jgi:hypothetical protein